jgi:hypothetical protein
MCGRFYPNANTWREIHDLYGLTGAARNLQPHHNVAPTDTIDVVRSAEGASTPWAESVARQPGGRLQIGTMAGFISERVAGFKLECLAGFVGIRRHFVGDPQSPRSCVKLNLFLPFWTFTSIWRSRLARLNSGRSFAG